MDARHIPMGTEESQAVSKEDESDSKMTEYPKTDKINAFTSHRIEQAMDANGVERHNGCK